MVNEMTVTFFGHRNIYGRIKDELESVLIDLIENHSANLFYVGNEGSFDHIVQAVLKELEPRYPHIVYEVVFAYRPKKFSEIDLTDYYAKGIYPEELVCVPKRFAIPKRNKWMLDRADTVVTYVKYELGGASQFKELAEKKGKRVINL